MNAWWAAALAGAVCGLLSGLGIGGGTLLMVWMTGVAALPQQTAQGINLLYFLPSAACALLFHIRNRLIRWDIVLPAALGGCVTAAIGAWIATGLDVSVLRRLFGSKVGKHRVKTLSGKAKKAYRKIPASDRLTKADLEQGSVTVSNIGSIYREQHGATALLEIVPPQIFAVAVGALQEKPGVYTDQNGVKQIGIRQVMPLCLAFDHRAVDFEALVPFMRSMDRLFAHPSIIHQW